jgi:hypothetical protein
MCPEMLVAIIVAKAATILGGMPLVLLSRQGLGLQPLTLTSFPAEDKLRGASSSEGTFSYFQSIARRECLGDVFTQVMSRPR